jgi:hypothetical protein
MIDADEFLNSTRKRVRRERKLSRTQIKMLKNVRDGLSYDAHCRGRSEHGGADGTWRSLVRRGLLAWQPSNFVITAAGRAALQEIAAANT